MKIHKGLEFNHPRVINPDGTPMRYVVTATRNGLVYYKPIDYGNSECVEIERFKTWVGK